MVPTSRKAAPAADALVKSSFSSVSSLMALQLFSRLFTFILNQALFRIASPSAFGTASIQFELILSTILFLSREGVRNAILRINADADAETRTRAMNLTFLPILVGFPLALCTSWLYIHNAVDDVNQQQHFELAVGLYATAALVELLSEPMYNMAMVQLKTNVRVRAEGLGITLKSIITFLILFYDENLALLGFAMGQIAYSWASFFYYISAFGMPWPSVMRSKSKMAFDPRLLRLSLTMTLQSVVKHFLTEGDKLVLSFVSPLQDQGGYALAVNYGSLIARIVLQPIEETLRVYFSKSLSSTASKKDGLRNEALRRSFEALSALLSVQIALSLILVVFGRAYLPIILPVLLPRRYLATSAPTVLSAWIYYIPALALNGGLEAFLSSAGSTKHLNQQSRWMVAFSVIYVLSAISFYRLGLGDASLVYANIINLTARILYCLRFAIDFFSRSGVSRNFRWQAVLPPMSLLIVAAISFLLIRLSERKLDIIATVTLANRFMLFQPALLLHICFGGILAIVCMSTWWLSSGRRLMSVFHSCKKD